MSAFRTVILDCDSTLSSIEGIDELAAMHAPEVAALTDAAMRGELRLEEVYGRRLALVRPTRAALDALGTRYVEHLVPDAREVVRALHEAGVGVRILSGGLLPAVRVLARDLGVDDAHVAAVDVALDAAGGYVGFDERSPLARAGGKAEVIAAWTGLERPSMLVGDGKTDLEARPAVDCFVAFAGVVAREPVMAGADVVVRSPSLAPVLALALGDARPHSAAARAVYDRGRALLESAPHPALPGDPP